MSANTALRIPCHSRAEAKELALRLEADGYRVRRRRRDVVAGTESEHAAEVLAAKLGVVRCPCRAYAWRSAGAVPVALGR
jgi:hypothetical protein